MTRHIYVRSLSLKKNSKKYQKVEHPNEDPQRTPRESPKAYPRATEVSPLLGVPKLTSRILKGPLVPKDPNSVPFYVLLCFNNFVKYFKSIPKAYLINMMVLS